MGMFNFFSRKTNSKTEAKNRLQLALFQDRQNTKMSARKLEMLKADILKVIRNYMEIDEEEIEIEIARPEMGVDDEVPVLLANIPIKNFLDDN